jgi:hypothetical protein
VTDSVSNVLFSVDPSTGARTVISNSPVVMEPIGVAVDAFGDILVADTGAASSDSSVSIPQLASGPS